MCVGDGFIRNRYFSWKIINLKEILNTRRWQTDELLVSVVKQIIPQKINEHEAVERLLMSPWSR